MCMHIHAQSTVSVIIQRGATMTIKLAISIIIQNCSIEHESKDAVASNIKVAGVVPQKRKSKEASQRQLLTSSWLKNGETTAHFIG